MQMTQKGVLSAYRRRMLANAIERDAEARAHLKNVVLVALNESSYAEVAKATGFSTNTLQRWKREASE